MKHDMFLGIDTSGSMISFGLAAGNRVVNHLTYRPGRRMEISFLPALKRFLLRSQIKPGQIDAIAVTSGPGRFTGIRLGLSSAMGLAYSQGIPVCGISCFDVIHKLAGEPQEALAVIPGSQGWIWCRRYSNSCGEEEPFSGPAEELVHSIAELIHLKPKLKIITVLRKRSGKKLFPSEFPQISVSEGGWGRAAAAIALKRYLDDSDTLISSETVPVPYYGRTPYGL